MNTISPILYIDLLKQSNYKTVLLLSMIHKQRTYFSKKYSKMNRIVLGGNNKLSDMIKDNIKVIKHVIKKVNIVEYDRFVFRSAGCGHSRIVRYVLNCGYDIEKNIRIGNYYSFTLFLYGAERGHIEIVKLLLDKGANIHVSSDDEALQRSAQRGHIEVVKYLLEKGIVTNIYSYDEALRRSVQRGHIEVVKLLLDKGADIHDDDDYVLHLSAKKGHIEIVKLLLEKGADVHDIDLNKVHPNVKEIIQEKLKLI